MCVYLFAYVYLVFWDITIVFCLWWCKKRLLYWHRCVCLYIGPLFLSSRVSLVLISCERKSHVCKASTAALYPCLSLCLSLCVCLTGLTTTVWAQTQCWQSSNQDDLRNNLCVTKIIVWRGIKGYEGLWNSWAVGIQTTYTLSQWFPNFLCWPSLWFMFAPPPQLAGVQITHCAGQLLLRRADPTGDN